MMLLVIFIMLNLLGPVFIKGAHGDPFETATGQGHMKKEAEQAGSESNLGAWLASFFFQTYIRGGRRQVSQ